MFRRSEKRVPNLNLLPDFLHVKKNRFHSTGDLFPWVLLDPDLHVDHHDFGADNLLTQLSAIRGEISRKPGGHEWGVYTDIVLPRDLFEWEI